MNYERYIVGVLTHPEWNDSYQFVFNDGTKTAVNEESLNSAKWKEEVIEYRVEKVD